MAQEIYVTEIKKSGIVIAVQGSLNSNHSLCLPKIGDNLFELSDIESSTFFKINWEKFFTTNSSGIYNHSIYQVPFQLTIHCYKKDTVFVYWQVLQQSTPNNAIDISENKLEFSSSANEFNNSLSLDFIDSISLPIFELTILPDSNLHFEYANNEMLSLFPNLEIQQNTIDPNLAFTNINEHDKQQFINSLKNIDTSKPWTPEFRHQIGNDIKWKKGFGHFSKLNDSRGYTLRAYLKDITDKKRVSNHSTLLEFAFRNAVTPIYYVNKDASFYDFNEAANKSLGYSREELMSKRIQDVDNNSQIDKWNEFWTWIKIHRTSTLQTIHRHKDGRLINVLIVSNLINYEERELLCAYIFDLSEKQKLEDEIKLADYSFKNIHTPIHIIAKDGSIFKYNPAAKAVLGYNEEEYKTLRISDIDPLYNADIWPTHWEELKRVGRMTFNTINKKRDGTIIPVEITTNFLVFEGQELTYSLFSDISQKVAEEERLRLLESVIVNTNDAVIITDANINHFTEPKIVYVNPAFIRMTGYTVDEVIGKNPRIFHSGKSEKIEMDKMRTSIKNFASCEVNIMNTKKNGENFWVNSHINPVANEKAEITHFIAVQRDITLQKITELEKERVLEELVAKNKKLRQFSYITTHNLRAPLTNLISASRMLKTESIGNPLARTLIDIFKKSTLDLNDTLNTLINTLLIQDNENILIQKLKFSSMLEKVCSINSHSIANTCCLITSDFSAVDEVNFNLEYLESIFHNLITNSIKYADPSRQPIIAIKSKLISPNTIQLIFSDNGIGMDMNLIKGRIFGLNQRFHDHFDSKGIGLYLIYNQLTALGGSITVSSQEHVGSTFYVNFKRK